MAFMLDDEIAASLALRLAAMELADQAPITDVHDLRRAIDMSLMATFAAFPEAPDVRKTVHDATAEGGSLIPLHWYASSLEPAKAPTGSAVVYAHGGGMVCGSSAIYEPLIRQYVQLTGVPFLSVDYRLAPEYCEVGLARDVFAGLQWLHGHAAALGVEPGRIAVMGDSGGGGVAAATAIMARDQGVMLARQLLIYPMLDDRNTGADVLLEPHALWTGENNRMAWAAVLGDRLASPSVSPGEAPARLVDFDGLAAAYIEVGELDIFRDESIAYAANLLAAGVSCELHVHPGAPHSYDYLSADSRVARRAFADRCRVINAI